MCVMFEIHDGDDDDGGFGEHNKINNIIKMH